MFEAPLFFRLGFGLGFVAFGPGFRRFFGDIGRFLLSRAVGPGRSRAAVALGHAGDGQPRPKKEGGSPMDPFLGAKLDSVLWSLAGHPNG